MSRKSVGWATNKERERQEKIRRKERQQGNIITAVVGVIGAVGTVLGYFAGKGDKK